MAFDQKHTTRFSGMRVFIITWGGQFVSTLGSGLTSFALGVWIYEQTGSPTLFVYNVLAWVLPTILFSPVVGVIVDRWDRRLVMVLGDSGAGLSSLFIFIMLVSGRLEVWQVYLATFISSAFSSLQWPAFSAATSLLVPKDKLGRASGMSQVSDAVSHLVTPALAGALYVGAGMPVILLIDFISYVVALGTLSMVRFPQPVISHEEKHDLSFWRQAMFGWSYIRQRPGLFGLLLVFASANFLMSGSYTLLTPMLLEMTTPDKVGLINSSAGIGLLSGTLLMSLWGGPKRRVFGIFAGEILAAFCLMLLGMNTSILLIVIASIFITLGLPLSGGCSQAIWQSKVAQDVQGRVFSIRRMIAFSIEPVAYLSAGPLAEKVFEPGMSMGGRLASIFGPVIGVGPGRGIALMFIVAGILYALVSFVIILHPRIRRLELELPDSVGDQARSSDL